jgi:glutaminyl-peptide cyclotransferase
MRGLKDYKSTPFEKSTEKLAAALRVLTLIFTLVACEPEKPEPKIIPEENTPQKVTPLIKFSVVASYPHDSTSFTEGFLFHDQKLFESTGAPDYLPQARSLFGPVDLKTGKIEPRVEIDKSMYFGEGIAFLNNKIYQLTYKNYKNQLCFVYDAKTFKRVAQFSYLNREGWGLTTNGKELIMSDGTNSLAFINPDNFQINKTLLISENNYAVDYLNELEYINGFIYANVWMTHTVVKIHPESGEVLAKMDLTQLASEARSRFAGSLETNGIAYDSVSGKILVTGKMWPKIYEIKFPI